MPAIQRNGLSGGPLAYDGQLIDDARLVVAVARTAAQHGTQVLTKVSASQVTGDWARLTDALTGDSFDLPARVVINATGVWAAEVDQSIRLRPSRGTHLVFDAAAFGNASAALTVPVPGETNRFVFAVPAQLGRVYLGLTDEDAPRPIPDVPAATDIEIGFLLDTIKRALGTAVSRSDMRGSYAGLRPLIDSGDAQTADLSRNHAVLESSNGVFSVVGGKLTEYRHMARDVVDRSLRVRQLSAPSPCRTRLLPLVGAPGNPTTSSPARAGLPPSLVLRYGDEANLVADDAQCDRPLDRVGEGIDVTRAELEFAVRHEGALDVADILDRRTRIGLVSVDRGQCVAVASELFQE